jgi:hypothetical protein
MKTLSKLLPLAAAALLSAAPAFAQSAKPVVAEPVAVLPSFGQWAASVAAPVPETVTVDLHTLRLLLASAAAPVAAPQAFQPRAVILGQPELPLLADAGYQAGNRSWLPGFNYQGMHVKVVVIDAGGRRQVRPLNAPLLPGERFKLRVTPSFDAVASLDRVVGDTWSLQRAGQVYPQAGMSVAMNPGETVDLPMAANEYFVLNSPAEKLVLSVRHPRAVSGGASEQPAYREDGARGSNYLQLVTGGRYPAFEQQLGSAR